MRCGAGSQMFGCRASRSFVCAIRDWFSVEAAAGGSTAVVISIAASATTNCVPEIGDRLIAVGISVPSNPGMRPAECTRMLMSNHSERWRTLMTGVLELGGWRSSTESPSPVFTCAQPVRPGATINRVR